MKRTVVLAAALVAGLSVGAAAQVKVKPGVGPGKGTGASGPSKLGPMTSRSPKATATTNGTPSSGQPVRSGQATPGSGSGQGAAKGVAPQASGE